MKLHPGLGSFLEEVTSSDPKHYLWLRSLGYLEYIGYRKMVKSLGFEEVNKGVFHHLTDEIQHSFILKELAVKRFGYLFPDDSFSESFQSIAEDYFQAVDGFILDRVLETLSEENSLLCYTLVSLIIEKRAMKVYPQYFNRLKDPSCKYLIQKIIKDESEHLAYLEFQIPALPKIASIDIPSIGEFEEARFQQYLERFSSLFVR